MADLVCARCLFLTRNVREAHPAVTVFNGIALCDMHLRYEWNPQAHPSWTEERETTQAREHHG